MLQLMKLALAICIITSVIIDLCNAQSKARRPRSRNSRRCPSACLRKIKQVELKPGPPGARGLKGPQGPQGSPGTPGPEGPAITLPVCKSGEYLTSNGTNLICKKLDLMGACNNLRNSCPNDGSVLPGSEGSGSKVPVKMVKFTKRNLFQSISTDAWDIEVFRVDGSLFLGLSQLGDASFQIFKWLSNSFKSYQPFKVMGVRNWAPFKIGNDQYFVLTNMMEKTCAIFRYDIFEKKFKNQSISLECRETVDVKAFKIDDVQHIVVANHEDGHPVVLWMWNGKRFTRRQAINITASYVEVFDVNSNTFLAISGSNQGPYVFIYKWDGSKFTYFQGMYMEDRPYETAAFDAGQDEFFCVSTMGAQAGIRTNTYRLMKWNGQKFESFQNITSSGARRITAISSPLMGKHTAYLAVINYFQNPEIYYWVGGSSTRFEKLQEMEATAARDMCFFEMAGKLYLLMASRKNIEIFRGELV